MEIPAVERWICFVFLHFFLCLHRSNFDSLEATRSFLHLGCLQVPSECPWILLLLSQIPLYFFFKLGRKIIPFLAIPTPFPGFGRNPSICCSNFGIFKCPGEGRFKDSVGWDKIPLSVVSPGFLGYFILTQKGQMTTESLPWAPHGCGVIPDSCCFPGMGFSHHSSPTTKEIRQEEPKNGGKKWRRDL